jgi:phosphoglycolate phosphatase
MPLDIPRIKALLFDVDGTLRDTDDQYVARFARWLHLVRFILPDRDANRAARRMVMRIETPANFLFSLPDRLGIDDEIAAFGDWLHKRRSRETKHEFLIIPKVQETLVQLAEHFPIAVVTARGHRGTIAFLDHYGITKHFKRIATAQTSKRTKPSPDPILWVAEQLNLPPEACLMIGDTTVDMIAGKSAGAQTVGVLSGFGEEEELRAKGADLILPSVADLAPLLLANT